MKAVISSEKRDAIVVAATAALFICIIVPLQTFFGNAGAFDFGLGRLFVELFVIWAVVSALLTLVLLVCGKWLGRIPHVLLLAFITYEYLATGILTIGFPSLDGESFFYANTTRRIIDSCVLAGLSLGVLICYKWTRKSVLLWSLGLLVMMFASLFDVNTTKVPNADEIDSPFAAGFAPKITVARV